MESPSPPPPHPSAAPPPRPPLPSHPSGGAGIHLGQHSSANPWGNYFSFLQQPYFPPPPQQLGGNSHFVGLTNNINPPSPVPPPYHKRSQKGVIDVDDVEASRSSVKKRYWTHDEEVRLASAWLNTSKDPIHGNDKRSDSFWGQITAEFNKNIHPDRTRDTNQLKVHWSRLSTQVNEFNGYWSTVCKMNKSGYSDDQLMDEAQKKFQSRNNGKPFSLVHWWRILKNEPKRCTHVAQTEKDKRKAIDVDGTDDRNEPRPIGREAAKAERKGKRKAEQVMDGVIILRENISKIAEISEERKKEREKVTEAQLEISRTNLQVAKEQKEAKLLDLKAAKEQKEAKLLEAYNLLLSQNTSEMSQEAKASREKLMRLMENKMFTNDLA
ncbi:unnamed protein product [Urochloa humidicola]